jgi:hypothetical protein
MSVTGQTLTTLVEFQTMSCRHGRQQAHDHVIDGLR